MKRIIILLAIIPILLNAQDNPFNCQFVPSQIYFDREEYTGKSDMTIDYGNPFIFNVEFHLIYENGVPAHDITEDELLRIIATLNIKFNDLEIFFKYTGFNFLEATTFPDFDYVNGTPSNLNDVIDDFTQLGLYHDNMINIFILNMNGNSSHFWDETAINNFNQYTENMITHELGHIFGLLHVFSGAEPIQIDHNTNPEDCPPPDNNHYSFIHQPVHQADSENITRDVNDPNYNASGTNAKGDLIHDTEACFYKFKYNFCLSGDFIEDHRVYDNSNYPNTDCYYCRYTKIEYCYTVGNTYYTTIDIQTQVVTNVPLGSDTWQDIVDSILTNCDAITSGIMYKNLEDINHNYMSYGSVLNYFTTGQKVRMYQTIYADTELQQKLAKLPDGSANFSVLYEPYKGIYFTSGNYKEYLNNPPQFQPGFDYVFVECGDGTNEMYEYPTPYGDTFTYTSTIIHQHSKTDFKSVDHPNHSAIKLIQADTNQPHKCWNNWNKAASSGSITKFNDGIINSNITIYPKDSLQINDIQLIHNLDNGLYKIEKQYDDGSQEQNIIIKDNE